MPTEHQVLMWIVYWAIGAAILGAIIVGALDKRPGTEGAPAAIGAGVGGFSTCPFAIVLGFVVKLYDVPGDPGLVQAIGFGLLGFLIGGVVSLVLMGVIMLASARRG